MPAQINSAFKDAGKGADKAGESMGSSLASGLSKTFMAGVAATAAAGSLAIGTALTKGFQRLTAIDNAEGKLEGLGHTSLGTAKIMESALASVKGTSFGLGEAATISASAVAAGIKPGKDLTRYLSITADAATIAGTSIEEMGAVMNKVQTKGKAYTLDLNQLAIRGIPIYQMLAKEMGVSQEALTDMVAEGKVDSATYLAAIEKNLGGAARAGNTVSAAWANTMAAMGRLGAGALKPTFGRTADWLKGITSGIDIITPKVSQFAEVLDHRIFNMGLPRLKKFGEEAKTAFEGFMDVNGGAITNNWDRLKQALSDIGDTASRIGTPMLAIGTSLAKAQAALGVGVWSVFLNALESVSTILNVTLVPVLNGLSSLMNNNQVAVTALAAAFLLFKTVPGIIARIAPSMASLAAQSAAGVKPLTAYQRAWQSTGTVINGTRGAFSRFFADVRSTPAALGATTGYSRLFSSTILTAGERTLGLTQRLTASNTALGRMGSAYQGAVPRVQAFTASHRAAAEQMKALALQTKGFTSADAIARQAYHGTAGAIGRIGVVAGGVGASGMSALGSTLQGVGKGFGALTGALGGPVGVGIMAAAIAIPALISSAKNWDAQAKITEKFSDNVAVSQRKMARAFTESKGAMSDGVLAQTQSQAESLVSKLEESAKAAPGFWDKVLGAGKNVVENRGQLTWASLTNGQASDELDERKRQAEASKLTLDSMKDLGIGADELSSALAGTDGQWKSFYDTLASNKGVSDETLAGARDLKSGMDRIRDAAKNVSPGIYEIAEGFKVLGDAASTTSQKASAFKSVMDAIAGVPPDLGNAMSSYNQVIREAKKLIEEPWDVSKGALGSALIGANGMVDTATENGESVRQTIQGIRAEAIQFVSAGGDVNEVVAKNADLFKQLGDSVNWTDEQLAGVLEKEGYLERVLHAGAALQGLDDVTKGIGMVQAAMDGIEPGKPRVIPVQLLNDKLVRDTLEGLGVKIEEIDNGANFRVTMDDRASDKVDEVVKKAQGIAALRATVGIDADTNKFDLKLGDSKNFIALLSGMEAKPGADLNLDKFKNAKQLTVDELADLSTKFADPKAFLEGVTKFLTDAGMLKSSLDALPDNKTVTTTLKTIHTEYWESRGVPSDQAPRISGPVPVGGRYFGARLPRNSYGSRLPTVGPGTDTVDGILGVGRDGVPTTWVDKGEWIINGKSSEKHNRLLAAINRDDPRLKNLPGFAEGGRNGIQAALSAGKSVDGNTYLWGATGPERFDCSGFVGWLQQIVMGVVGSVKRLYTTHDLMGSSGVAGLQPGLGPAGTQFQVGVSADHMAATIAGHSAESGGAHGTSGIDGGRANAQSSHLPKKWHLPNSEIADWVEGSSTSGGYSYDSKKKVEWTEKNQLDLESATIAIQQAKEARDKVYANSKKSQADRDQADKRVQKAEQRVIDLQKKKDDAAAGKDAYDGPAPQAPEMERIFSDDEAERLEAQMQVDDAELRRNEVYADLDASENDRTRADIALQKAQKNLEEVLKGKKEGDKDYSLNGIMKRFAHSVVDAGFSALEGQDYFGLMQSRWFTTDWQTLAGDPVIPANSSQADIDGQTGGMPWYERLLRDGEFTDEARVATGLEEDNPLVDWVLRAREMKAPKVFDNGGWLLPGESAINLSTKPEPIFNSPAQLGKFMGGDGLKPAQPAVNDYSVHFHGDVSTRDDAELVSKLRFEQKRMVYGLTGG